MKTLNICDALLFSIFAINFSFAQTAEKKETIKVSGNCGMCKNKIEKAAKAGGASVANWNEETKALTVSYNSLNSSSDKIQRSIAASGYDTQSCKADNKAYNELMGCCKYDRNANPKKCVSCSGCDMKCCGSENCCDKNGKCDEKTCKTVDKCQEKQCCKS